MFGASTVAGVALSGAIAANSAQAATMTYRSDFSVTSNFFNDADVITGDFNFSKTELNSGEFSYKLRRFNAKFNVFNEEFNLSYIKANPDPFLAINQTLVPEKYRDILPNVLAEESFHYTGDGDFGEGDSTFTFGFDLGDPNFQADNFDFVFSSEDLDNAAELASNLIASDPDFTKSYINFAFKDGGQINVTTKEVPEPTAIFGIGMVGVGLTATRRKRASNKIKEKVAA